jgi:hypothetical protein
MHCKAVPGQRPELLVPRYSVCTDLACTIEIKEEKRLQAKTLNINNLLDKLRALPSSASLRPFCLSFWDCKSQEKYRLNN